MARILKIEQIEAKKKALLAESEVYRQTLQLEIQNLRVYGQRTGSRFKHFSGLFLVMPLLVSVTSMLSKKFRRGRRPGWRRLLSTALMGWRFYRKFGPASQSGIVQWLVRKRTARPRAE